MTVKDWLQAGAAALVLLGVFANVRVSMALRERDRKDFEDLRAEHNEVRDTQAKHETRIAILEERTK